jgi:hypothetical protein
VILPEGQKSGHWPGAVSRSTQAATSSTAPTSASRRRVTW